MFVEMNAQILEMPPSFVIGETKVSDSVDNLGEFGRARKKVLEKCLLEDKWLLSEKSPVKEGVDLGVAEEHFLDNFFAGWDDAFLSAYKYRGTADNNGSLIRGCINDDFFSLEVRELTAFVETYRRVISENLGREFSFDEAFEHFGERYYEGWRTGWRAGFCGCSCNRRNRCSIGCKYDADE